MNLTVHSDGHLYIVQFCEQIYPEITPDNQIEFTECYDLILRNYGSTDINCLYIFSPHNCFEDKDNWDPLFTQENPADKHGTFDWIYKNIKDNKHNMFTLVFDLKPSKVFDVVKLNPQLSLPDFLNTEVSDEFSNHIQGSFWGTDVMLAKVTFGDGIAIKPFDPENQAETTYWIRLCFKPRIDFTLHPPLCFGNPSLFYIQPHFIYSSSAVLDYFNGNLNCYGPNIISAIRGHINNIFQKPQTSTAIEDCRISLLTSEKFLVFNPYVAGGACKFLGIEKCSHDHLFIRTWYTGTATEPYTDPLELGNLIYSYLEDWAKHESASKRKENIATGIGLGVDYNNVCHVVEALSKSGYLKESNGHFTTANSRISVTQLPLKRIGLSPNHELKTIQVELLNRLYGSLPVPSKQDKFSRFCVEPFRIQYELAYKY